MMSGQAPNPPSDNRVWQWHYPTSAQDRRRRVVQLSLLFGVGFGCLVWAAVAARSGGSGQFAAVLGVMLLGLLVMSELDTRRARATVLSVDRMGLLTFADSRTTTSVDLRTASPPVLRLRSHNTGSRWSLEVTTPEGAWHKQLANIATYWKLAESDVRTLESELQYWSSWARGGQPPMSQTPDPKPTYSATPLQAGTPINQPRPLASGSSGTLGAQTASYQWTPAILPNAERNRRRIRVAFGVAALLIAAFAVINQWENGLAAVGFSMFVPVLVVLLGVGIDLAYRSANRFRIDVADGVLAIHRGSKEPIQLPLHTITGLAVDSGTTTVNTGQTSHRTTVWSLKIHFAHQSTKTIRIPTGLGSGFNTDEAIKLEAELQQFLPQ